MQLNVLNDLTEAMKALEGKNDFSQIPFHVVFAKKII